MARIAGVNIPAEKRIEIALRYIHGIGPARAAKICEALKLKDGLRAKDCPSRSCNEHQTFTGP